MNKAINLFTTPNGEEFAILPRAMLDDMIDLAAYDRAITNDAKRGGEALTTQEMRDYLAAVTPLAFWRKRRGLTQAALAKAAGTTQPYIADLESAKRGGSMEIMGRIASALNVSLDDLK